MVCSIVAHWVRRGVLAPTYLLPSLNVKLRPKLCKDLKPGTRIVSHDFDMGEWKPEETVQLDGHTVYFWTVPAKPLDIQN
jgi:hypothetical protein